MTQSRQNFTLSDGRNLEYLTNGLKSDSAVILHAGTTQDITGWQTWLDYLASKHIFALSIGRSGYAGSTKKDGRITIDIAHDVAELASHLGINKFVNIGLSGGGQHAIATGLDSRSAGVVTVGSLAPFDEMGDDFYTGMQQADLDEYADAIKDINLLVKRFQKWQDGDVGETIVGAELSDRDKLASSKPTWKVTLDSCAYTMEQGWDWVADDYSSYLKPWGFDPRDINVPTVIWQAELDKNVPIQHGKWLAAHMPNSRLEIGEGETHLGLFVNYEEEIMQSAIALLTSS
ncbi:MhpC Predicted hydrolases or acyltransferases (alpha/beta hydrolase superfamily) [Candidatus Nanopelagicaceae bacterium]